MKESQRKLEERQLKSQTVGKKDSRKGRKRDRKRSVTRKKKAKY